MQKREKLLIYGLVAVVLLWKIVPAIWGTLYGPIDERKTQLAALEKKAVQRDAEKRQLDRAKARMRVLTSISLPPNELDGQRLYQSWITDLATATGFRNVKVTPQGRGPIPKTGYKVQVKVEGEATLSEFTSFLDRFRKTPLLHRVVDVRLVSPTSQGDPRVKVELIAEGVSLSEAPPRETLFPQATLAADLGTAGSVLEVADAKGFPAAPGFELCAGGEYLKVTKIDGTKWTVVRGAHNSKPAAHKKGELVDVLRIHPDVDVMASTDVKALLAANPFAKPAPLKPYDPQLGPIARQTVLRGTPWTFKPPVTGLDSSRGKPVFSLADGAPEGLSIDEKTGELSWSPDDEFDNGDYDVTLIFSVPEKEKPQSRAFKITLREANSAPKLAAVPPQTVYHGRKVSVVLKATDDGPADKLTYKLGAGAPAGCTLDEKTGKLEWIPGESIEPGETTIPVSVVDGGSPPLSANETVKVTVKEDTAAYTFFTGLVVKDGTPEAWLRDRLNNRVMVLTPGVQFQIADITGTVHEIAREMMTFDASEGRWQLRLGGNLRDVKLIAPAPGSTSAAIPRPVGPAGPLTLDAGPAIAEIPSARPPIATPATTRAKPAANEPAEAEIPVARPKDSDLP